MNELDKLTEEDLAKCSKCGEKMVPAEECINFTTKKWDGYSYKFNCKCQDPNLRISQC